MFSLFLGASLVMGSNCLTTNHEIVYPIPGTSTIEKAPNCEKKCYSLNQPGNNIKEYLLNTNGFNENDIFRLTVWKVLCCLLREKFSTGGNYIIIYI